MNATTQPGRHEHTHAQNRFAVIPTPSRLQADTEFTGRGVTIAFLDSGFYPHPDLTEPTNRILGFEDITRPGASLDLNESPPDWDWHGTQTSVVAAGNGHLSNGVYRGLASDAQVVLVKASKQGRITEKNIARGIEWVIENKDRYNIRVLSISLGGDEEIAYKKSLADQLAEEAVRQGIVVVTAAGNSGCREDHRPIPPANAPSVITVGGYDDKNQIASDQVDPYCSSFGPTVDGLLKPEIIAPAIWVAAPILPGTDAYRRAAALSILEAAPDYLLANLARGLWQEAGLPKMSYRKPPEEIRSIIEARLQEGKIVATHYQHVDGTSFAAPIVASVVAQMIEANPNLTPAAVKQILISTAERICCTPIERQGYGMVNARRAVEQARQETHALDPEHFRPPRVESGKIVFFYHNDAVDRVALAGDFNDWQPDQTPFARDETGTWKAEIDALPSGQYRYKFVVNGGQWVDDPSNGLKATDDFGGLNSVLIVS